MFFAKIKTDHGWYQAALESTSSLIPEAGVLVIEYGYKSDDLYPTNPPFKIPDGAELRTYWIPICRIISVEFESVRWLSGDMCSSTKPEKE